MDKPLNIKVSKVVKKFLDDKKIYRRETYDDLLKRLFKIKK